MDMATIASKLVEHCRNGTEREGLQELYAQNAESVEAKDGPSGSRVAQGRAQIRGKHDWWAENFEVHSSSADGPYIHDNSFAVIFEMDVTEKASGERSQMKEVALYHVSDGKIVREEFFAAPEATDG